jgi:MFS family permease
MSGAMMNGLQTLPQWRNYFNNPSGVLLGIMNAIYPIGKIIGILVASVLCDRFGRKPSMWLGLPIMIVGAAIQGGALNLGMFMAARFILGFGNSLITLPTPILIAELAYPTHRGKMTAMYNTFYVKFQSFTPPVL